MGASVRFKEKIPAATRAAPGFHAGKWHSPFRVGPAMTRRGACSVRPGRILPGARLFEQVKGISVAARKDENNAAPEIQAQNCIALFNKNVTQLPVGISP